MKILFLSTANSSHTVNWVNALAERGHEVILISKADHHERREDAISQKVNVIYLPITGMKGYYLNAPILRKLYKGSKFDVINVHYASGYGTLARAARLPHILLSVWGSDVFDFPYKSKVKEYILRKNLAYADMIASTSVVMCEQTRKFLKMEKDIRITPFGVDIQKFSPSQKKDDSTKVVFGIVKPLEKIYGILTVIKAFAFFLDKLPIEAKRSVLLEIYGDGNQEKELKDVVKEMGLEKQVLFRGYISNSKVPDALRKMDIFVLGSERESFGVSAVEAMACGLPVIATDVSGLREVIKDREMGFLVKVNDAVAMAEKMLELYKSQSMREEMGNKGRLRVEKSYNWKENVDNMVEIYREIKSIKNN